MPGSSFEKRACSRVLGPKEAGSKSLPDRARFCGLSAEQLAAEVGAVQQLPYFDHPAVLKPKEEHVLHADRPAGWVEPAPETSMCSSQGCMGSRSIFGGGNGVKVELEVGNSPVAC